MDLIKELVEASRVSRKSAASVYHRDYERTKNKPYRKYDKRKHAKGTEEEEVSDSELAGAESQVEEGAWDFIKGAAGHVGNTVKQAVGNTVQAGQTASLQGDLAKKVEQLGQALAVYDKLKATQPQPQQPAQQQPAQQQVNPARQRNPQNQAPAGKPGDAVPAAFRSTTKPRIRNGEFVFSAFLQQADGDFLSEGAWDFLKGAAGHVGNTVKQAVGNTVQAGQDASNAADYQKAVASAKQLAAEIAGILTKLGNAQQALEQVFSKTTMNPMMQQRIQRLVTSRMQQRPQQPAPQQ